MSNHGKITESYNNTTWNGSITLMCTWKLSLFYHIHNTLWSLATLIDGNFLPTQSFINTILEDCLFSESLSHMHKLILSMWQSCHTSHHQVFPILQIDFMDSNDSGIFCYHFLLPFIWSHVILSCLQSASECTLNTCISSGLKWPYFPLNWLHNTSEQ